MPKYIRTVPEGLKDMLFEECAALRKIEADVGDVFLSKGYQEVLTSPLEYYDVFSIPGAAIPQQEMYKTTDNNGRIAVFRPDSTLPIARLVSSRLQNHRLPIRLFYRQSVLRNLPDLSGRHDESRQIGIELIGAGGIEADIEVISLAVEGMRCVSDAFRIEIGHAGFFRAFADRLGASDEDVEEIRRMIESKNYAALSSLLESLPKSDAVNAIGRLPRLFGGEEVLLQAERYCSDETTGSMLEYLKELYNRLCSAGLKDRLMLDLGLVQRNDYYTGMIFGIYTENYGEAVATGGRYDSLFEKFGARQLPAAGFAIDADAAIVIDKSRGGIRR